MTELNTPLTFKCTKNDGINEGDTRDYFDCEVFDSKLMVLLTLPDATIEESFTLQELIRRANAYDELSKNYSELIMAVGKKFKNETRHETALRYINESEAGSRGGTLVKQLTNEEK